jgi:TonB family protein
MSTVVNLGSRSAAAVKTVVHWRGIAVLVSIGLPIFIPILLAAQTAQAVPPAPSGGASPALQEPAAKAAPSAPEQPWPPAGVFRPGGGVSAPKVTKEVRVGYTPDAMRAKVQGGVALEAVVRADGTVGEVRVVRSLDQRYGLDDEAVKALKQWQFTPGRKDGAAVPVVVEVEMTFTIGKPR